MADSDNPYDQFVQAPAASDDANPYDQFVVSATPAATDHNPYAAFVGKDHNYSNEGHGQESKSRAQGASEIPGNNTYVSSADQALAAKIGADPAQGSSPSDFFKDPNQPDPGAVLTGLGRAGVDLATGMAGQVAGAIGGLGKAAVQVGTGRMPTLRQNFDDINNAVATHSSDPNAQQALENISPILEGMQALGPAVPHFEMPSNPMAHIQSTPLRDVSSMNGMDQAHAAINNVADILNAKNGGPPTAPSPYLPQNSGTTMEGQLDLGNAPDGMNIKPQEAGAGPLPPAASAPNGMSPGLSTNRQMGFDFTPDEPLTVTPQGTALKGVDDTARFAQDAQNRPVLDAQLQAISDAKTKAAQDAVDQRQTDLEMAVKKQASLDNNASERQRQAAAAQVSDAQKAHDSAVEAARLADESAKTQGMHQSEIDDTQHVLPDSGQVYGAQYGTGDGVGRVDENGMPIRADRSIEAQQLQDPLQRNLWGDELPQQGEQEGHPITQGLDQTPHTDFKGDPRDQMLGMLGDPRAQSFNARTRGQGGGLYMGDNAPKIIKDDEGNYRAFRNGEQIGKLSPNMTADQNRSLGHDPEYPATASSVAVDAAHRGTGVGSALYKAFREDHNDNVMPSGQTTPDAWKYWKRNGADKVEAFVNQEAQRQMQDPRTASRITDPDIRRQVIEKAEQNSYVPGQSAPGFNARTRYQGGGLLMDANKRKTMEGIGKGVFSERFKTNFRPTPDLDAAGLIQHIESMNPTDLDQNGVQKAMNFTTKGSAWMDMKVNDPIYKTTSDVFRDANGRTHAAQETLVNRQYAKQARGLSDADAVSAWSALKQMEAAGKKMTPQELASSGLSAKAQQFIQTHQSLMDMALGRLNEGQKATGMMDVHPEAAYVASKAQGAFRRAVFQDGKQVGYVGADTRQGLNKQMAQYKAMHPEYTMGPEQSFNYGDRGKMGGDFEDTFNFLANTDPAVKAFLDSSKRMRDAEAANYRGIKSHTMDKKGIEGMAGNAPWKDALTNAREGMQAQVRYLDKVIGYSEKGAAYGKVGPMLDHFTPTHPNSVALARRYMDMSMGRNPTRLGNLADSMFGHINDSLGGGVNFMGKDRTLGAVPAMIRTAANLKLIGGNMMSMLNMLTDPIKSGPVIASMMEGRGLKFDPMMNLHNNLLAAMDQAKLKMGNADPLIKQADAYARENGVYRSGLFQSSNSVTPSLGNKAMAAAQMPHNAVEQATRQNTFLAVVRKLAANGDSPEKGMFYAAKKATDMIMNNHNPEEGMMALKAAGAAGKIPSNLMTYKMNQMSLLSAAIRDAVRDKQFRPLVTALGSMIAMGGVMSMTGYKEADDAVRFISEHMHAPTSLTDMLINNADKQIPLPIHMDVKDLMYGLPGAMMGLDFSNRSGVGYVAFDPSNLADSVAPGLSTLTNPIESGVQAAVHPSDFNTRKFVSDSLPGAVKGIYDRKFMSRQGNEGQNIPEASISGTTGKLGVPRDDADKFWKSMSGSGSNESFERMKVFEAQSKDKAFTGYQNDAVSDMTKAIAIGASPAEGLQKFLKYGGTSENAELQKAIDNGTITSDVRDAVAASRTPQKMKNRFH